MRTLLKSLLIASATITPMFTIGQYVDKTANDHGNFCTRWDAGSYQAIYKDRFEHLMGYEPANQKSGLRTRGAAHDAMVHTCTGSFPTFGIRL